MAINGHTSQPLAQVLAALSTLQGNVDRSQKTSAHEYLESFQKSSEAWTTTWSILQSQQAPPEAKLFAATTLKGKITYDLHQLPRESLPQLRDSLLAFLKGAGAGSKPLRTQLCVCLANLAIQMTEWKNVFQQVVTTLSGDSQGVACLLEFLHVLPEEVTEGRKINLSEEDLQSRTTELLQDNSEQVLSLLIQYSQSSASAARNPQLLECITSWLQEVPINTVVNSTLLNTIMNALATQDSFDSAVECLSAIFKETQDVDECLDVIQKVFPRINVLKPKIAQATEEEDTETFRGLTRIFSEAGEAWVVLIARMPEQFRELVAAVLECAARDKDREAISLTFNFWYELKQLLTIERYIEARAQLADLFSILVDIMIGHLQFPKPESGNERDLFEGDREQEEKFREFRHQMGDVLKDCCEVIGVTECLRKPYDLIEKWVSTHGRDAQNGRIPQWQSLEAPLFSMRAMGRMVTPTEDIMLPRLIPLITQIPDQEKVRFQAVMALGRYTEWTAKHPETLQAQLQFILAAFDHPSQEVVRAAALSFRFFCIDCADLLKEHVAELQQFYETKISKLQTASQEEITEGVAAVLAKQPPEQIYPFFKLYCDPVVSRLKSMARSASNEKSKLAIADQIQLVTTFVQIIQPHVEPPQTNPAVQYCEEIFPILTQVAEAFSSFIPILERVCRCWRNMVLSYRSNMAPLLPQLAHILDAGFALSRQGCFLWVTTSVVREFSEGSENVDSATSNAIFQLAEQQTKSFLRALSDMSPEELPDVIEDFFRLQSDVIFFYPLQTLSSTLMPSVLEAASHALTLLKEEPLMATLHFLRDFIGYGSDNLPQSSLSDSGPVANPREIQLIVKQLLIEQGEIITQRLMTGLMYSFPRDCFPDASGALLGMFQLIPTQVTEWIKNTIALLPEGSVTPQESQRLIANINQRSSSGDIRRIRTLLQDFTNSYRRRNVAPREGLGRLEATRFRFAG